MAKHLKSNKTNLNIDLNKVKKLEEIKLKTNKILENRKDVNYLIDLLSILNSDAMESISQKSHIIINTTVKSLTKIFVRFIHNKEMLMSESESEANKTYKDWLKQVYGQSIDAFIHILDNDLYSKSTRILAINSLMRFVSEEGKYPFNVTDIQSNDTFPQILLTRICKSILSSQNLGFDLIQIFSKFLEFDDVIHYTLKALKKIIDEKSEANEFFIRNTFELLLNIKLKTPEDLLPRIKRLKKKVKKNIGSDSIINNKSSNIILCVPTQQNQKYFKIDYERDADLFASVWLSFLGHKLPVDIYKEVLQLMDKHIMTHFRNPLTLTDFLIDSYNVGGIASLLSLTSLYVLIQKCNLDYPKFYERLYNLLTDGIIYVKYRPQFLFWCDVFLSTSHISGHIIASFIKRLSRIALTASSDAILILLPMIGNLMIRHPSLKSMVRSNGDLDSDPFDNTITDPENTNAINSFLWEVKTLQNHFHTQVAKAALFINKEIPNREWDLSELLETSFDDIIDSSLNRLSNGTELTFDDINSDKILNLIS